MPGCRYLLSLLAIFGALLILGPTGALADSAGDQQYIDPLAGNTTPSASAPKPAHPAPGSSSPSNASAPSAASASAGATASASSSQPTTSTPTQSTVAAPAASSTAASQPTLPFTGLNVWLCAAVGLGLLGAGLVLRRVVRST